MIYLYIFLGYLGFINIIGWAITWRDKRAAIKRTGRVSEKSLLLVAFLCGSVGMYITMLIIRHKTMHKKFMVGIPLIIAFQLAIAAGIVILLWQLGLIFN